MPKPPPVRREASWPEGSTERQFNHMRWKNWLWGWESPCARKGWEGGWVPYKYVGRKTMPGGKKRTKPINYKTIDYIHNGIMDLKIARTLFRAAEANNTVIAVNKAIKSAEGALRHARLIYFVSHDPGQVSPP